MSLTSQAVWRKVIAYGASLLLVIGCATTQTAPSKPASAHRQQPKRVDIKAQQRVYDQGLQYYSEEHYNKAQESFKEVIRLGPNTSLAAKARENLKKIDQILKTLKELESK